MSTQIIKRASDLEIDTRRNHLGDVIERFSKQNKIVNWQLLLKEMNRTGYPGYNRDQLQRDRTALNVKNTYIRDFLPNYSAFQQEIKEDLDFMMNETKRLFQHDWETTRTHEHENKDGSFTNVTTITDQGKIKVGLLNVMTKIVDLKQRHGMGQNIQIGAVIIGKEIETKKKQIKILQVKLSEERPLKK